MGNFKGELNDDNGLQHPLTRSHPNGKGLSSNRAMGENKDAKGCCWK